MAVLDCALLSAVSAELVEAGAFSPPFGLSLSKSGGCLGTVRAEPVEAWACWFGRRAGVEGGGRVVAPAGDSLSFASPKESKQRKGDPQSATPALRYGANLRRGGCGVRRGLALLLRSAARTTTASQSTKHARSDARATPQPPRRRRSQQGVDSRTAEQPPGPLLRSTLSRWRKRLALRRLGRAKQWPVWMSDSRVPFCMRLGRAGRGVACASERACFVN